MSQFGRTIDFRGRGPLARLPHAESSSAVVRAEEAGKNCFSVVLTLKIGLCSQSWPNQVRQQFLALYLVRRTTFWVSSSQKILFSHSKDTSGGSAILKFVSGSVSPIHISCIGNSLGYILDLSFPGTFMEGSTGTVAAQFDNRNFLP